MESELTNNAPEQEASSDNNDTAPMQEVSQTEEATEEESHDTERPRAGHRPHDLGPVMAPGLNMVKPKDN